jgi:hypothetical protein
LTDTKNTTLEIPRLATAQPTFQELLHALLTTSVPIDAHSVGDRWQVQDIDRLARLIAVIAMGQAIHAAKIIRELSPASPALNKQALRNAAKRQLRLVGQTEDELDKARWRRDGFIFEAISWIAARQSTGANSFLKDPHLKSTTQGIDGLMIEMDIESHEVIRATIFEDKCSDNPRRMFRDQVMPAFKEHHGNSRGPELVAAAGALIEKSGLDETAAIEAAARVLDLAFRRYRAALTINQDDNSQTGRRAIFKGYEQLESIEQPQRVGATFVVDGELRAYFDRLAERAIAAVDDWEEGLSDV